MFAASAPYMFSSMALALFLQAQSSSVDQAWQAIDFHFLDVDVAVSGVDKLEAFCESETKLSAARGFVDDFMTDDGIATVLLQNKLELDHGREPTAILETPQRQEERRRIDPEPEMLLLIVSHHGNSHLWDRVRAFGKAVHPNGRILILTGFPNSSPIQEDYILSFTESRLTVNSSDNYDRLPEKMFCAYNAIAHAPELQNITHVLKIDDNSIFDEERPWNVWNQSDILSFSKSLAGQPGHYFSPEHGYLAIGQLREDQVSGWHLQKSTKYIPLDSYWRYRTFKPPSNFTYASGETGYVLTRHALTILSNRWPLEAMTSLYHTHIYEDQAVGITLWEAGENLTAIDAASMPEWHSRCKCSLPCIPNSSSTNFTMYNKMGNMELPQNIFTTVCRYDELPIGEQCCFVSCQRVTGLCRATVHL
jgi:hypothetical protein